MIGVQVGIDDTNLRQMFAELEPKRRKSAIRGGMRKLAGLVRKTALRNLHSCGLRAPKSMDKGVTIKMLNKVSGFRVTLATQSKSGLGLHHNRWGVSVPVLVWAEMGARDRRTKGKMGNRKRADRMRASHSTGSMPRYGFMAKTQSDLRGKITDEMRRLVIDNVIRVSKKYGCK